MRNIFVVFGLVIIFGIIGYFLSDRATPNGALPSEQKEVKDNKTMIEPSKECGGEMTPSLTEGPYYKSGSPERISIRDNSIGEKITVAGYVFNQKCEPIKEAWLDFWQANGNGNYDNAGFNLRGHQFTDENGKYVLETVLPGRYPGRTPHIHVKVRAKENGPVLTSQLYFPGENQNTRDSIFNSALVVKMEEAGETKLATFNFVVPF